jgi:hypothetical protein
VDFATSGEILPRIIQTRSDSTFSEIRQQNFNLDFVKRQRLTATPVRFIRNRTRQDVKLNSRENHTNSNSPFEGYVFNNYISPDAMVKATVFTAAVSANISHVTNPGLESHETFL